MKLSRRQKRILKRKLKRIAGDAVAVIVGAGMFVGLLIAWANEPMPDWSEYTEENHIGMVQVEGSDTWLTQEEYEKMKKHTVIGWSMLQDLKQYQEEPLVRIAEQICRWHHERYDGGGYPDGLKGEEIPIAAQVVSIADAYDALISPRVYKEGFSHEQAMQMIRNGECGAFNPLLIECLEDSQSRIRYLASMTAERFS